MSSQAEGPLEARSRHVLTPEEHAIMIVCGMLKRLNAIDHFLQLWKEGVVRDSRTGAWSAGQFHV